MKKYLQRKKSILKWKIAWNLHRIDDYHGKYDLNINTIQSLLMQSSHGAETKSKLIFYEFDKPIYKSNTNDTVSAIITPYIQQTPLLACLNFSACAVSARRASDAIVISFSALFNRRTCVFDSSFSPFDYSQWDNERIKLDVN